MRGDGVPPGCGAGRPGTHAGDVQGAGGYVDLKLDHHTKDGIEVVDVDLVCTQERILKIFRITGLTKVFGIHDSVDEAIAARKSEK